jgi:hypothetical protein
VIDVHTVHHLLKQNLFLGALNLTREDEELEFHFVIQLLQMVSCVSDEHDHLLVGILEV